MTEQRVTTTQAFPDITWRRIDWWCRTGLLHPLHDARGSGVHRRWDGGERRAARALDSLHRLGGVPSRETTRPAQRLAKTVADLARAHPAGTVNEIATPDPWVRVLLVVPTEDAS